MKKGYHKTKSGRIAKKGLYYNMNKRKKAGTSRPGKGTVSAKALKASAKTAKSQCLLDQKNKEGIFGKIIRRQQKAGLKSMEVKQQKRRRKNNGS